MRDTSRIAILFACLFPLTAAEYLPVCEKCLNPRVVSKSGTGTSAAGAEARVVQEDAAAWCAANRPRDAYCAREEVTQGGDGRRKSFRATADCSAGILHSISGGDYVYAGTWPDGPGRGRPMLRDPNGNIPLWNSVTYGRGVARSEWHLFGGYSLTGQWEVLCAGAAAPVPTAQAKPRGTAVAPAKPVEGEWLASCFRCPAPAVVSKSGIGTANAVAEARMQPEDLRNSCAETDPQNIEACVRRELAAKKTYRAAADCTAGRITTIDEQSYTLAGIWDNSDIGGGRTKWRGSDGQVVARDNVTGGLGIAQQWEVLCPAPLSRSLLAQAASPAPAARAQSVAAAPARTASVCEGKRYCSEVGSFAAIVRDFRPSSQSDATRLVSATVRFLNKTNRPLTLGYIRNAGVAIDEQGNRYVLMSPESVRGIGEIAGRDFDPKFTIQPGQTADARFEFAWRWNGRDIIGQRAWDIDLTVREVSEVAPGQYRFGQEHALQFKAVPGVNTTSAAPAAAPLAAPAAPEAASSPATPVPEPVARQAAGGACAGKRGCYDAGLFTAEIAQATLTREGNFQDRIARLNVRFRNTGTQPITLAYVARTSVLIDNFGKRFAWGTGYDNSATGIGKVESNKADPQFVLAPGETRAATFTLYRRRPSRTDPDGTGYTWDVTIAQLEVLYNGQQVRTVREHTLTFPDFGLNMPGASAAPSAGSATDQPSIRKLGDALRRLGNRK